MACLTWSLDSTVLAFMCLWWSWQAFESFFFNFWPHPAPCADIWSDRAPEELWTEVCDIVQEAVIKIIPQKKKYKKAKWLSEEALQIAEKRREAKGKREKESYIHLNAEFQRISRRDKKTFLGDQCKEMKENSRLGKTREFFKKN